MNRTIGQDTTKKLIILSMMTGAMSVSWADMKSGGTMACFGPLLAAVVGAVLTASLYRAGRSSRYAAASVMLLMVFAVAYSAKVLGWLGDLIHTYSFAAVDPLILAGAAGLCMLGAAFFGQKGMEGALKLTWWLFLGATVLGIAASAEKWDVRRLYPWISTSAASGVGSMLPFVYTIWPILLPAADGGIEGKELLMRRSAMSGLVIGAIASTAVLLAAAMCRSVYAAPTVMSPIMTMLSMGRIGRFVYRLDPLMCICASVGAAVGGGYIIRFAADGLAAQLKIKEARPLAAMLTSAATVTAGLIIARGYNGTGVWLSLLLWVCAIGLMAQRRRDA